MHEVHCRRHLKLCEHCQEPVPRTEMEQHFNDVHAKVACTLCKVEVEKEQLDIHMVRASLKNAENILVHSIIKMSMAK